MGLMFGLVLAFALPLIFLGIICWLDFYQTGQPKLVLLSLLWGGIVFYLAIFTNNFLLKSKLADQETIIRIYAPIYEEIFKGLFLLYLIRLPKFAYFVDGAVYGFAAGIGFAIVENFGYITDPYTATAVAWQRVLSANLVHATGSAIIGIALGIFHLQRTRLRWLVIAFGLFLAIDQHMMYNMINEDNTVLIFAFGAAFLGLALIFLAMQLGKNQARAWIRQKLGMLDGVTLGEVALVDRLPTRDNLLLPVVERFGPEKGSQVEQLLYHQARLAIKRKALESIQDDVLRSAVEKELRKMQKEMKDAQRAIGAYVMLFVRGLFTDQMLSVWERMQAKIRERSASNDGRGDRGVWSSLEERLSVTDVERRNKDMDQDIIDQLKKINWFIELPESFFTALAKKVYKRILKANELLFNKGDEGDSLFVINAGRVKVFTYDQQGNEVVLNQVESGEIIGEMALFDYKPRSAGILALEDTSVMELKRDDFLEILESYPDLALSIIRNLISRLRHNTRYIEKITDLSRRVAQGDYSFLGETQYPQTEEEIKSEQGKIKRLMAEFYAMVQGVREREEELREQVQKLALQIDEAKRKQVFEEITKTDFYASLKEQAQTLRAQRKDNK